MRSGVDLGGRGCQVRVLVLKDFTNEGSWLTLVVHGVKKIFHEAGSCGDVGDIGRCLMCLTGRIRLCLTDVKDTDAP